MIEIVTGYGQRESIAGWHNDRRRPDLDYEFVDIPGNNWFNRFVKMSERHGVLLSESSFRWEARSQPCVTDAFGSTAPTNNTSLPCGSNSRSVRKRSMSSVVEDTNNVAASGPVISDGPRASPAQRPEQSGGEFSSADTATRTDHEAFQITQAGPTVSVGS
jgi:hypothetical protein